ncbi:RHTO0S08e07888g1_1 [Rhodotorula toruloides]|uniref:RHTO0S08e07888g1_1 n=2 Tax=Rhodotorula toruloides TaxID=5286 RepID=A0A061B1V9_RHOTO|nr:nucleotide-binding protein [Rhodotorula toruloides NP11]EMS22157.1 nucleotide-binding protein [Rhodotorula toruloides NP11]KAJ8294763.1 hypothetical protein OF846_002573 [Rhodotorula toruloides]CDR43916.1 RHTO0S08e07888g1_1 [Rhodotorula toruloides]
MTTPVSLPLTATLPAPGTAVLPPSVAHALPSHLPPSHGHHRSASSISSMNAFVPGHHPHQSSLSGQNPFVPAPPAASTSQSQTNQTRILLLENFSATLKTKDLQELFSLWQDQPGGLKVKWRDDTSAWVVFGDAGVAKRAFLSLIANPPLALSPLTTNTYSPCITPYNGPDVQQILQAVQNRPRSRSIAGGSGHQRKSSVMGSGGGAALAGIGLGQPQQPQSSGGGAPTGAGHHRTASWTRQSIDRRMRESLGSSPPSHGAHLPTDSTSPIDEQSGGAPWRAAGERGHDGWKADGGWRTASPETPGGPGGIVAGEAPRRFGGAGVAHERTESRGGAAGPTFNE